MPIIRSAQKALRQNIQRRKFNRAKKAKIDAAIAQYKKSITANKKDDAAKHLAAIYGLLDKAAKTHLYSRNKSSRLKSRLGKLLR